MYRNQLQLKLSFIPKRQRAVGNCRLLLPSIWKTALSDKNLKTLVRGLKKSIAIGSTVWQNKPRFPMFFFQHCTEASLILCYCRGSSRIRTKCQWRGKVREWKCLPWKYAQRLDPHKLPNSESPGILQLPYCTVDRELKGVNVTPKVMRSLLLDSIPSFHTWI